MDSVLSDQFNIARQRVQQPVGRLHTRCVSTTSYYRVARQHDETQALLLRYTDVFFNLFERLIYEVVQSIDTKF